MPRVAVAGGSLGGLTAALVLRDAGCEVAVFERAARPLEGRGAGIVLHPVTARYLAERAGVDLAAVSAPARRLRYLARDGSVAHEQPCAYRFTSYATLYRSLLGCLDPARYRLGAEVVGFKQDREQVTVRLAGGRTVTCDLLVCADGAHSTARRLLLPAVRPAYAGYVAWRGTVEEGGLRPRSAAALRQAITYYLLPGGGHILAYPIPGGPARDAPRLVNWVWYRNVPAARLGGLLTDRAGRRHEGSLPPGSVRGEDLDELREAARRWLPPPLAEAVTATAEPFVQVVLDVEVPRMAFGRACLLGDAAFVLRPHVAAGTAKAADDAWRLAEALAACGGDVRAALARWEPGQLALGRQALARAREAGDRAQHSGTWQVGDPLPFGLYRPGDSALA